MIFLYRTNVYHDKIWQPTNTHVIHVCYSQESSFTILLKMTHIMNVRIGLHASSRHAIEFTSTSSMILYKSRNAHKLNYVLALLWKSDNILLNRFRMSILQQEVHSMYAVSGLCWANDVVTELQSLASTQPWLIQVAFGQVLVGPVTAMGLHSRAQPT